MIKSLFEPDEKQPADTKAERNEKPADDSAVDENFESHFAGIEAATAETGEPVNLQEIFEPADDELIVSEKPELTNAAKPFDFSETHFDQPEKLFSETINDESLAGAENERTNDAPLAGFPVDEINLDLPGETTTEKPDFETAAETSNETAKSEPSAEIGNESKIFDSFTQATAEKNETENSGMLFQSAAKPESFAETARKSGLAYAAAITLFGAVVFMLIIGWFADLLLGSSPWGIVGGIIIGAAIGFIQFFRMTSQIFKNKD